MVVNVVDTVSNVVSNGDLYRQLVMQFLLAQSDAETGGRGEDGIKTEAIFDAVRDRYLILSQGWRGQERVYWVVMHLELRQGKVWIQRNQTEVDIEAELVALGIAPEDIVRGLIPPEYRVLLQQT